MMPALFARKASNALLSGDISAAAESVSALFRLLFLRGC